MKAAFATAWKFVATDAALEAVSAAERRISLGQALMALVSAGERDVVQLVDEAVALVRKVHAPPPSERLKRNSVPKSPPSRPSAHLTRQVTAPPEAA